MKRSRTHQTDEASKWRLCKRVCFLASLYLMSIFCRIDSMEADDDPFGAKLLWSNVAVTTSDQPDFIGPQKERNPFPWFMMMCQQLPLNRFPWQSFTIFCTCIQLAHEIRHLQAKRMHQWILTSLAIQKFAPEVAANPPDHSNFAWSFSYPKLQQMDKWRTIRM